VCLSVKAKQVVEFNAEQEEIEAYNAKNGWH
jgi:hypothetical protein